MPICHRCKKETLATIVSMFNLDKICLDCQEKERSHPKFEEAQEKEGEEVRKGNFNFPGIGKPPDL